MGGAGDTVASFEHTIFFQDHNFLLFLLKYFEGCSLYFL